MTDEKVEGISTTIQESEYAIQLPWSGGFLLALAALACSGLAMGFWDLVSIVSIFKDIFLK